MKNSELIKRLQAMPSDAEVLTCVVFAQYHTTDTVWFAKDDAKVVIEGELWTTLKVEV